MTTKTDKMKQAAFALNLGLVTHIGSFESVDDAQAAIQVWREDDTHNRMGVFCYIQPLIESEAA